MTLAIMTACFLMTCSKDLVKVPSSLVATVHTAKVCIVYGRGRYVGVHLTKDPPQERIKSTFYLQVVMVLW